MSVGPDDASRTADAPVDPEYHARMTAICGAIDDVFNGDAKGADRKVGFILMVFKYGEEGRANFMSNGADRKDLIVMFKELIARFEGMPFVQPGPRQ